MMFKDKYFVASIIVHTFLCPLIYSLCIAYKFYVWYYYLDFMYSFVSFLPFSMHSTWITSREKKFTIKYGVAELIVVYLRWVICSSHSSLLEAIYRIEVLLETHGSSYYI